MRRFYFFVCLFWAFSPVFAQIPEENRFEIDVLEEGLREPIEFVLLPSGNILYIEHRGDVRLFEQKTQASRVVHHFDVFDTFRDRNGVTSRSEDGLLGVTLDPNFAENGFIYFYLSPAGAEAKNSLIRLEMSGDSLLASTRKTILDVPTQRDECCHTGGSMAWDEAGNLFLSTGDNTNPFASDGFAPIDPRPGRAAWDALGTSGNTNDLRGKILRIRPLPDGSYSIPEGNLFPKNLEKTRPEIFVMGNRNPYRMAYDKRRKTLFWGEVGPDAPRDSSLFGPRGHDEIGQAREPLFAGWPLFVGDNKPYRERDFLTENAEKQSKRPLFDPKSPKNESPNNTGLVVLPPARPAFIWYPYGESAEFPLVRSGGRNAMAGPVFWAQDFEKAARKWPAWFDGRLMIYDWIRGWTMAVEMDSAGGYLGMHRVMPSHRFSNPIDMAFGPEGDLFVLEYGKGWFQPNPDARLLRIRFNAGNRPPQVKIGADRTAGGVPLEVHFSSAGTMDFDRDSLQFSWKIFDETGLEKAHFSTESPVFTFRKKGVFTVELAVSDGKSPVSNEKMTIWAGNEPPQSTVEIVGGNSQFFFEKQPVAYRVSVDDREDGSLKKGKIKPESVNVQAIFRKNGPEKSPQKLLGKKLIDGSDCASCHAPDKKSVGPSWGQIALRYQSNFEGAALVSRKIISGGSGAWGETPMAAHPAITPAEARRMAEFILSFSEKAAAPKLAVEGDWQLGSAEGASANSVVEFVAEYSDRGTEGLPSLRGEAVFSLKNPIFEAVLADSFQKTSLQKFMEPPVEWISGDADGAFFALKNVDLTDIGAISLLAAAGRKGRLEATGGHFEIRIGSPTGPILGKTSTVKPTDLPEDAWLIRPKMTRLDALIDSTAGRKDLFFVFKKSDPTEKGAVCTVADVIFQHKNGLGDGAALRLFFKKMSAATADGGSKIQPFLAENFDDLGADFFSNDKKKPLAFEAVEVEINDGQAWASGFLNEKRPFLAVLTKNEKGAWQLLRLVAGGVRTF